MSNPDDRRQPSWEPEQCAGFSLWRWLLGFAMLRMLDFTLYVNVGMNIG